MLNFIDDSTDLAGSPRTRRGGAAKRESYFYIPAPQNPPYSEFKLALPYKPPLFEFNLLLPSISKIYSKPLFEMKL